MKIGVIGQVRIDKDSGVRKIGKVDRRNEIIRVRSDIEIESKFDNWGTIIEITC